LDFLFILTTGIVNSCMISQVFTQPDPVVLPQVTPPLKPVKALFSAGPYIT